MTTNNRTLTVAGAMLALGVLFLAMCPDASTGDSYTSYAGAKVIAHLPLAGTVR